jgi:hypothetical protein
MTVLERIEAKCKAAVSECDFWDKWEAEKTRKQKRHIADYNKENPGRGYYEEIRTLGLNEEG